MANLIHRSFINPEIPVPNTLVSAKAMLRSVVNQLSYTMKSQYLRVSATRSGLLTVHKVCNILDVYTYNGIYGSTWGKLASEPDLVHAQVNVLEFEGEMNKYLIQADPVKHYIHPFSIPYSGGSLQYNDSTKFLSLHTLIHPTIPIGDNRSRIGVIHLSWVTVYTCIVYAASYFGSEFEAFRRNILKERPEASPDDILNMALMNEDILALLKDLKEFIDMPVGIYLEVCSEVRLQGVWRSKVPTTILQDRDIEAIVNNANSLDILLMISNKLEYGTNKSNIDRKSIGRGNSSESCIPCSSYEGPVSNSQIFKDIHNEGIIHKDYVQSLRLFLHSISEIGYLPTEGDHLPVTASLASPAYLRSICGTVFPHSNYPTSDMFQPSLNTLIELLIRTNEV